MEWRVVRLGSGALQPEPCTTNAAPLSTQGHAECVAHGTIVCDCDCFNSLLGFRIVAQLFVLTVRRIFRLPHFARRMVCFQEILILWSQILFHWSNVKHVHPHMNEASTKSCGVR